MSLRRWIGSIPLLGSFLRSHYHRLLSLTVDRGAPWSAQYWDRRYACGLTSGSGSYGQLAAFKAEVLNDFVKRAAIESVIEFGCGDGNQLSLAEYPTYYGYDVSPAAIALCRERFAGDTSKRFGLVRDYDGETADLALSLDVIYHLVEDNVFEEHIRTVFRAATGYVIIYSSDRDDDYASAQHVRHRRFTEWVECNVEGWALVRCISNRCNVNGKEVAYPDFYVYEKELTLGRADRGASGVPRRAHQRMSPAKR